MQDGEADKMARKVKTEGEEMVLWRRPHGKHTTRIDGVKKRYAKGEPVPFPKGVTPKGKDWECVSGDAQLTPVEEQLDNPMKLELKPKGGGWYDVVNVATGEAINDAGMKLEAAEALLAENADEDKEG